MFTFETKRTMHLNNHLTRHLRREYQNFQWKKLKPLIKQEAQQEAEKEKLRKTLPLYLKERARARKEKIARVNEINTLKALLIRRRKKPKSIFPLHIAEARKRNILLVGIHRILSQGTAAPPRQTLTLTRHLSPQGPSVMDAASDLEHIMRSNRKRRKSLRLKEGNRPLGVGTVTRPTRIMLSVREI